MKKIQFETILSINKHYCINMCHYHMYFYGLFPMCYLPSTYSLLFYEILFTDPLKSKAVPLHAMEVLGGRGGIAPTHSRPRH
jgi:hypothetical protein